jgi:hypothetical protein
MPAALTDDGNTSTPLGVTLSWVDRSATDYGATGWFYVVEWIGQTWDFGATLNENGLRLDPPAVQSLQLSLTSKGATGQTVETSLRYVSSPGTTAWGTVNPTTGLVYGPGGLGGDTITETELIAPYQHTFTAADEVLTYDLLPVDNTTWTAAHKRFFGYMQSAGFDGLLQLSIQWELVAGADQPAVYSSSTASAGPVLTTGVEVPFHTGFQVPQHMHRSRAVHDPRSGMPLFSSEAVEDAWTEGGVWLHPDEWDPEDSENDRPDLPSTEGEIDDEKSF